MYNTEKAKRARFLAIAHMPDLWRNRVDTRAIFDRLCDMGLYSPKTTYKDAKVVIFQIVDDLREIAKILS